MSLSKETHMTPLSLNFFILVKKTFLELFSVKKFLISFGILIALPVAFTFFPIIWNLSSSSVLMVSQILKGSIFFPCYIWTCGAVYTLLIGFIGSPLISEKVRSGSMIFLITKPIRREAIYFGKLLALILYNTLLSLFSILFVILITVLRYTGSLAHFISLMPFFFSLFIYSLFVNVVFSSITISFSAILNNARFVLLILILITIYLFVIFPFFTFTSTTLYSDLQLYTFDLGYHFVNVYFEITEILSNNIQVGSWLIYFLVFTGIIRQEYLGGLEGQVYIRTYYFSPLFSLFLWTIITVLLLFIGLLAFSRKEIFA
ncbi:MAG: ABC transporter permease [Promethearchaeota archaeon]|nr:MAG: ABC transporter permease [Candidatus Lokiarchaeota archaeon]